MSKAEYIGLLEDNGTLYYDAQNKFATRWTLLVAGTSFQGGSLAVNGGDGTTYVPVMLTDPADGTHVALTFGGGATYLRPYTFDAACDFFQFVLSGGSSPTIELWMLPEQRP